MSKATVLSVSTQEDDQIRVLSCGVLGRSEYHRAGTLGSGSFGAVVDVYDNDGNSFALKMFEQGEVRLAWLVCLVGLAVLVLAWLY
jgi:hypothetical protein